MDGRLIITTSPPRKSTLRATVRAAALEIFCPSPDCERDDPIPAPDGSFLWADKPEQVTCPDCHRTYKLAAKIT